MNENQRQKLKVIKEKMRQRDELLQELEESITIRSLATDIPIGEDERCAIAWREVKGKFVLRIQNAAGETQEVPDSEVPKIIQRPPNYEPFKFTVPTSIGTPRKRKGGHYDEKN